MINKIVRRNLWKKKFNIIGISIILIFAFILLATAGLTIRKGLRASEELLEEGNPKDTSLYVNMVLPIDSIDTKSLKAEIEAEYPIKLELKNAKREVYEDDNELKQKIAISYNKDNKINKNIVKEGRMPEKDNEIFIMKGYADANGYGLNGSFSFAGNEYKIVGLGYNPMLFERYVSDFSIGVGKDKTGVFYMMPEAFANVKSSEEHVINNLAEFNVQFTDDSLAKDERKAMIEKIEKEQVIEVPSELGVEGAGGGISMQQMPVFINAIPYEGRNADIIGLEGDLNTFEDFVKIIVRIFVIFAIGLFVMLYKVILTNDMREIGILKAEGFLKKQINIVYRRSIIVIVSISAIFGLIFGTMFSNSLLLQYDNMYNADFEIGQIDYVAYLGVILNMIVILIIIFIIVSLLAINSVTRRKTLNLIKGIGKERKPRIKISSLTKKLPFKAKYKINILFRNFPKVLLLIVSIVAVTFISFLGVILYSSITYLVNTTFDEQYKSEYMLVYGPNYDIHSKREITDNDLVYITMEAESIEDKSGKIKDLEANLDVSGLDKNNEYITLLDKNFEEIDYGDGIVVSSGIANKYDVEKGDKLILKNPYNNDEELTYEVKGIEYMPFQNSISMDIDILKEDLDLPVDYYNTVLGDMPKDADGSRIKSLEHRKEISKETDDFFYMSFVEMHEKLAEQMGMFMVTVQVVGIISLLTGFIMLNTVISIIIRNNKKSISMMKVLGYSDKEVKNIIIAPFKWIVLISYLLSVFVAIQIIKFIIEKMLEGMDLEIVVYTNPWFIVIGLVLIMLVYIMSARFNYRKIKKTNLSESLKIDD